MADIEENLRELVELQNDYNATLHDIQLLVRDIERLQKENESLAVQQDCSESFNWSPLKETLRIVLEIDRNPELEEDVLQVLSQKLSSLRMDLSALRSADH
ncbi:uncharacterized protein LOC106873292 [Octopus bimaculoides]|uniref:Uncharacterized protein n=1 Tax=Octopus bimaculoides TaxID=37653 RepID=A0A0L8H1X0_OCTBM|nr:uncharacterized protein LOC106873292 [Octopus bimaculoides]|eukprot:XP_014776088.1 PREDICTED: uncharacterized protein LOC106873292 [Octopus bimaculoides]